MEKGLGKGEDEIGIHKQLLGVLVPGTQDWDPWGSGVGSKRRLAKGQPFLALIMLGETEQPCVDQ